MGLWGSRENRRDFCFENLGKKEFSNGREVNGVKCYREVS